MTSQCEGNTLSGSLNNMHVQTNKTLYSTRNVIFYKINDRIGLTHDTIEHTHDRTIFTHDTIGLIYDRIG